MVTFSIAKRFYKCLGKVEHVWTQCREPSELPSPGQLISNEWNGEAETSDCRKQSIVIAVSQPHAAWDSSLSQTAMNKQEQRLGRREIQVKEKHSHMNWRNQWEMMDKQCHWKKASSTANVSGRYKRLGLVKTKITEDTDNRQTEQMGAKKN